MQINQIFRMEPRLYVAPERQFYMRLLFTGYIFITVYCCFDPFGNLFNYDFLRERFAYFSHT